MLKLVDSISLHILFFFGLRLLLGLVGRNLGFCLWNSVHSLQLYLLRKYEFEEDRSIKWNLHHHTTVIMMIILFSSVSLCAVPCNNV